MRKIKFVFLPWVLILKNIFKYNKHMQHISGQTMKYKKQVDALNKIKSKRVLLMLQIVIKLLAP